MYHCLFQSLNIFILDYTTQGKVYENEYGIDPFQLSTTHLFEIQTWN